MQAPCRVCLYALKGADLYAPKGADLSVLSNQHLWIVSQPGRHDGQLGRTQQHVQELPERNTLQWCVPITIETLMLLFARLLSVTRIYRVSGGRDNTVSANHFERVDNAVYLVSECK